MTEEVFTDQEESKTRRSSFDAQRLLRILLRNSYWMVLCAAAGFFIAKLWLRYQVPVYNVNSTVLVGKAEVSSAATSIYQLAGMNSNPVNFQLNNEILILKSYDLVGKVVDSLNLQYRFYRVGRLKKIPVETPEMPISLNEDFSLKPESRSYFINLNKAGFRIENKDGDVLLKGKFGRRYALNGTPLEIGLKNDISNFPKKGKDYLMEYRNRAAAIANYSGRLNIKPSKETQNMLELNLTGELPEREKAFINVLIHYYNQVTAQYKNEAVKNALNFLNMRIDTVSAELELYEDRISEFKVRNQVVDPATEASLNLQQLRALDQQQATLEYNEALLTAIEKHIKDYNNRNDIIANALSITDPVLQGLVTQYNTLVIQKRKILETGAEQDPNRPLVEAQMDELRTAILKNIRNIRVQYEAGRAFNKKQEAEYLRKFGSMPFKEQELLRIRRQMGIKEALFQFLLQKKEEVGVQLASGNADISRIVDLPRNTGIVSPVEKNVIIGGTAAGFLLPLLIIVLMVILNKKVETKKEIENVTDIPIAGEISESSAGENLVIHPYSRDLITEQYRALRANLQFFGLDGEHKKVILITSFMRNEGKSFTSINLASALAQTGKKTIILEFDLRKPKIAAGLKINNKKGITQYLATGKGDLSEYIVNPNVQIPSLYVMTSGIQAPNPAELIHFKSMETLFEALRQQFDYIVIDSAPVGLVSDTYTLASYADMTLYIVRHKYTEKETLHFANELYIDKKLPGMALLVNGIRNARFNYGSYYANSYGYGYGVYGKYQGYDVEEEK